MKTQIYAQAAVHEYWLVDLSSRSVSRYSDPRDGAYLRQAQFRPGETIAPAALPQCAIPVEALLG